jgi:hypothetical protein
MAVISDVMPSDFFGGSHKFFFEELATSKLGIRFHVLKM